MKILLTLSSFPGLHGAPVGVVPEVSLELPRRSMPEEENQNSHILSFNLNHKQTNKQTKSLHRTEPSSRIKNNQNFRTGSLIMRVIY